MSTRAVANYRDRSFLVPHKNKKEKQKEKKNSKKKNMQLHKSLN